MEAADRQRRTTRGLVLATAGLLLALAVVVALSLLAGPRLRYRALTASLVATLLLQGGLLLVVRKGWSRRLSWDRHFAVVPALVASVLLNLYGAIAPEWRALVLMVWLVALLFLVGLAGFFQVLLLSTAMTAGYLLVVAVLAWRGAGLSLSHDAILAGVFWILTAFAAVLFEHLRKERRETRGLRRQLGDLALTDALTSLPNRRQLEQALRTELARRRRHGGALSVALIDVDQHPAGDPVLMELATLIRGHLRQGDVGARYGNEEFSVVMVGAGRPEAEMAVERLRAMVEAHPFQGRHASPGGRLTISAGIATAPDDSVEYEELVEKAERALQEARSGGGNRVGTAS